MHIEMTGRQFSFGILAVMMTGASALRADPLPAEHQTALVHKYCAVCHTDAARNGGLSLEHYDAAKPDAALAAMLLSKLRNGAMGAAGLGVPDKDTQAAWIAATTEQAAQAKTWTVIRNDSGTTASIVREVAPRKANEFAPVYRLILGCDSQNHGGDIRVTWSPAPQIDRTFLVSADGGAETSYRLGGKDEHMGNGTSGTSGQAYARLSTPLPEKTLTISDVFPGETVVFPIGDLDAGVRRQLGACFSTTARK